MAQKRGRTKDNLRYYRMIDAGENPSTKPCPGCSTWRPLEDFGKARSRKDGLNPYCRSCSRARLKRWSEENPEKHAAIKARSAANRDPAKLRDHHRKHRYGMAPGEFDAMTKAQRGVCAICRVAPASRLVVDHDHNTGKVRGLLCDRCNHALHIVEQPELLAAAQAYLAAHRGNDVADQDVVGRSL